MAIWIALYVVGYVWGILFLFPIILEDIGVKDKGLYNGGDIVFSAFIALNVALAWPFLLVGLLLYKSGVPQEAREIVTRLVDGR